MWKAEWKVERAILAAALACAVGTSTAAALPVTGGGGVAINEIRIDQTGADNDEYFELSGTPGSLDGLTYLVIGDGTGGSGVIESVTDLTGSSIGASGYFVAAESTFTLGVADLTTSLNFENSDNVTHLLVSGFTGADGDDLDTDDDGTLDATPWTAIVDCIALLQDPASGDLVYCADTVGPDGTFVPGHAKRCPDTSGSFAIGAFDLVDDTPGATNDCTTPPVAAVINEIRIDQTGADNDEYFELSGAGSLDGATYLVIGDGIGGSGVIESVTDLTGLSFTTGYFVAAESTFTLGVADLTTTLNFENGDNVTHLLVMDFTGLDGDDLDVDDDGVLDVTPWSAIVDCIALLQDPASGDFVYCADTVGPDGTFVPGHAKRCDDTSGPFVVGMFDLVDDTPGATNDCAPPPPDVVINEIRTDNVGTDVDEYFELSGSGSLDTMWYVVIGDGTGGSGVVENATDLTGFSIDSGGYFLAAEPTFTFPVTPDLVADLNFENSDNVTHMLVTSFTGLVGDDLDADDDGVLDVAPWDSVLDCIALLIDPAGGDLVYCADTVGPDGAFAPGHAKRCDDTTGPFVVGDFDYVDDTPRAVNDCSIIPPKVAINEIRIDQTSDDNDEYFELSGTAGDSLDGLAYVVIGDDSVSGGVIESVTDLTGLTIPAGGYFLAAEATFTFPVTPDLVTDMNFENSDNVTHLLVLGFTGMLGDDLDADDDGIPEVTPWDEVIDCIALVEEVGAGDPIYCAETVGPDGTFVPGHAKRCADTSGPFVVGMFELTDDTPRASNSCDGSFESYCVAFPNSVSADGARMDFMGTPSISAGDSVLVCNDVPDEFGLFFFGSSPDLVFPFGNGVLCVGAPIVRLNPPVLPAGHTIQRALDFTGTGPESIIVAGNWYFQFWYRDPFQGAGFNTSDGLHVVYVP